MPLGRGSSPLTRGKPGHVLKVKVRARLIPAHAGKTWWRTRRRGPWRAHPRSRGENGVPAPRIHAALGSSPLTRGKPRSRQYRPPRQRLIPAHAGKTRRARSPAGVSGAHPRSRGENVTGGRRQVGAGGSSPLTRGKPHHQGHDRQAPGLIPAHAGKTWWRGLGCRGRGAHPRSRGENDDGDRRERLEGGSSPLTRGKHWTFDWYPEYEGLIPAHAGKTPAASEMRYGYRAHPRSRGENTICATVCLPRTGSSPLTRGKRLKYP